MYYIEFVNFCCFLQKYWHQHVVNPISINHYLRLNQFNDNINLEVLLKNSMAVAFDLEMYLRNYGSGSFFHLSPQSQTDGCGVHEDAAWEGQHSACAGQSR